MPFKPGISGNPTGRAKSNKTLAMTLIMDIFEKHEEKFKEEMGYLADKNIIAYYLKFVVPVQPKQLEIEHEMPEGIQITVNERRLTNKS